MVVETTYTLDMLINNPPIEFLYFLGLLALAILGGMIVNRFIPHGAGGV